MIITEKNRKVVSSHDFDSVNCTIDAEDMRYVASLLRNNYSNTALAVVREISANALDANTEANSDRNIEIKLPSAMNPTFSVRDFGGGLSQEDIFGLYSKYGKSTKRESNNYIGAFGIGKFAPLSYGDSFTCVSYHGGMKNTYNVFVNDDDDTKIAKIGEGELSNEPTGLSIQVAVSESDINNFREIIKEFFIFFSQDEMPKFIGCEDDFIVTPENLLESKSGDWFLTKGEGGGYYNRQGHVLMGRVSYKIDPSAVQVENYINKESNVRMIQQLLNESNFYLRVPLGSVKLHHSRESLEYNKSTQKELCKRLFDASIEIQANAKEILSDSNCLFDARKNYAQVVNALPQQLKNVFKNSFEWNGMKISNPSFDRNHKYTDSLLVSHYEKEDDKDSRNGFKVKHTKHNRVFCQDNTHFIIQDLESSHGNNLRVRTLMNKDDTLKNVYVIRPTTTEAKDYLWNVEDDGWNFKLVNKIFISYSSKVEKEKIVRNNVSGEKSRASIPLFKMIKEKSYGYRNADYWQNSSDPINSIETEEVKGSVDGKLIYIPIKNYKTDFDGAKHNYALEQIRAMAQSVRSEAKDKSEEKEFVLFGVRYGDVKKLDDEVWVSFIDFYLDFCKSVIMREKPQGLLAYKKSCLQSSDLGLHEYQYDIGKLLSNPTFDTSSLSKDHIMVQAIEDWKLYDGGDLNRQIINSVNYVKLNDKDWLKNTFGEFEPKQVEKDFESLCLNYPLLRVIAMECPYYVELSATKAKITNKMILDYLSLCDMKGGGDS